MMLTFNQSIHQSINQSFTFFAPKHLWAKQIQSAHIPSNPTAADMWSSLQTGKPLSTVGSPVGPAWRRSSLCGREHRGGRLGFKSPRGALGVLPAGREVTSQPYLMGFLVSVATARKPSLTASFFSSVRLKRAPERSQPLRSQQVWCNGRRMAAIYR